MINARVGCSLRSMFFNLLVLATLTTACKKSGGADSEIDPRNQYVGTYVGTYRNSIYIVEDMMGNPVAGKATVAITKGSNPKEIYIELTTAGDRTGDKKFKVTAELNGVNFTVIDKNSDTIPIANPVASDYSANGVFDPNNKQFAYSSVANALRNGAQYRQTYEVVGTKE